MPANLRYVMADAQRALPLDQIPCKLLFTLSPGDGYNCPYGQNCALEPAPPGRTPDCARPGLTYCVHPEPYPEKIIRQLIEAGQYDISTLLSDESRDEFSQSKKHDYPYDYGPNSLPHVDQISLVNDPYTKNSYNTKFHTRYNHGIFSQKTPLQPPSTNEAVPYNVNAYQSSNFSKFGFHGYSPNGFWNPTRNFGDFDKKFRQGSLGFNQNFFDTSNLYPNYGNNEWLRQNSGVTRYNPNEWWKYVSPSRSDVTIERSVTFPTRTTTSRRRRNAELVEESRKRTLTGAEALRIALGLANEDLSAERPRRQAPDQQELCSVRTEFTNPRAALNNKGNWKYVVNMPDSMSQLVRTEICTSTECSGLCTIPPGYTSRCEQKYIQKRLVALQSNGQNLYTDVFWIPSCCQCTITPDGN
ncbi:unnamed protein product [Arctia plantaginis]|uniref:Spaetzle domain-containing protein n=1 Tax=Arctia plantaginis TaxID=874455 RepID=A0A8S1A8E3_ARCPL|nr:unnamed protein product [Arctia plantaginis]